MKDLKFSVEDWEIAYQNKVFQTVHNKIAITSARHQVLEKLHSKYGENVDPVLFMESVFPPFAKWVVPSTSPSTNPYERIQWKILKFPYVNMLLSDRAHKYYLSNKDRVIRAIELQGGLSDDDKITHYFKKSLEKIRQCNVELDDFDSIAEMCLMELCSKYLIVFLFTDYMEKLALFSKKSGAFVDIDEFSEKDLVLTRNKSLNDRLGAVYHEWVNNKKEKSVWTK